MTEPPDDQRIKVTIRVTTPLFDALVDLAAKERRTMNNLANLLLIEALAARDILTTA